MSPPKSSALRLSPEQLADAEAALQSALGRKIAPIVAHYLNLEARAKSKGVNLDASLSFLESHFRGETQEISILNAYNEFVAGRTGGSPVTKTYYENTLRLLLKPNPNKDIHTYTVSDIENCSAIHQLQYKEDPSAAFPSSSTGPSAITTASKTLATASTGCPKT